MLRCGAWARHALADMMIDPVSKNPLEFVDRKTFDFEKSPNATGER